MAKNIFTEKAMEQISSPEKLDQHVKITRPAIWMVMVAVVAAFIGVGYWACTGNISDGINISGIIFPSKGVTVSYAPSASAVTDVLVSEGEKVQKGDVIAVVPNEDVLAQIDEINAQLESGNANNVIALGIQKAALKFKYMKTSLIKAEEDGVIQSVVSMNSGVEAGSVVAKNIGESSTDNTREVLAYIPYTEANLIKVGMNAQVSPVSYDRSTYGYINGVITAVGSTPVTSESVLKQLGTTDYINSMNLEGGSFVEVRIRLNVDATTKSGYSWSSKKGKDLPVDVGSICGVKVITEDKKPISLIFNLG